MTLSTVFVNHFGMAWLSSFALQLQRKTDSIKRCKMILYTFSEYNSQAKSHTLPSNPKGIFLGSKKRVFPKWKHGKMKCVKQYEKSCRVPRYYLSLRCQILYCKRISSSWKIYRTPLMICVSLETTTPFLMSLEASQASYASQNN